MLYFDVRLHAMAAGSCQAARCHIWIPMVTHVAYLQDSQVLRWKFHLMGLYTIWKLGRSAQTDHDPSQ